MGLQLAFHIAIKTASLPAKSAKRWRRIHILIGYLLIAVFVSHSDFSLPDTVFEWALWAGFVVVTLSGIFGTYLAWSLRAKHGIDEKVSVMIASPLAAPSWRGLSTLLSPRPIRPSRRSPCRRRPMTPGSWTSTAPTCGTFSHGPRNLTAHLIGSQRQLRRLTDEIDNLSQYVDQRSQEKLAAIRNLVVEKDRLDFARVHLGLARAWLFVHVPVTYALIVLTLLHILVVYSYSSGLW